MILNIGKADFTTGRADFVTRSTGRAVFLIRVQRRGMLNIGKADSIGRKAIMSYVP